MDPTVVCILCRSCDVRLNVEKNTSRANSGRCEHFGGLPLFYHSAMA
jgi:hypothetical protein